VTAAMDHVLLYFRNRLQDAEKAELRNYAWLEPGFDSGSISYPVEFKALIARFRHKKNPQRMTLRVL
jgi:hypothetical protein